MHGRFSTFAKGLGTGAIIGIAMLAAGSVVMGDSKMIKSRNMRKRLSHAARTASDMMCSVSSMLK